MKNEKKITWQTPNKHGIMLNQIEENDTIVVDDAPEGDDGERMVIDHAREFGNIIVCTIDGDLPEEISYEHVKEICNH